MDHIIPETLLKTPAELAKVLQLYGLPAEFDVNSCENWLPACVPCNNKKRARVFDPAPVMLMQLATAKESAAEVREVAERTISDSRLSKALAMVAIAVKQEDIDIDLLQPLLAAFHKARAKRVGRAGHAMEYCRVKEPAVRAKRRVQSTLSFLLLGTGVAALFALPFAFHDESTWDNFIKGISRIEHLKHSPSKAIYILAFISIVVVLGLLVLRSAFSASKLRLEVSKNPDRLPTTEEQPGKTRGEEREIEQAALIRLTPFLTLKMDDSVAGTLDMRPGISETK
ncbi:hypothetical protein NKI96_24375 [Mesorhizobium sp. M0292]|uniref:hypothetical protein n=1 Tax=Mesorhizobium sp. M0292 TaxID=2956929 RepID=UPI003339EC4A